MEKHSPIVLLDKSGISVNDRDLNIIDLTIDVFSEPLRTYIGFRDCNAKLTDMVPVAYSLSDKLNEAVLINLDRSGIGVSCHKGCSYCCHYIVAVSPMEAFHLRNVITSMPASRRESVLGLILKAVRQTVKEESAFHNFEEWRKTGTKDSMLEEFSDWYRNLNLACPFLTNDCCCIYQQRPLVCRECMSTSKPLNCKDTSLTESTCVPIPVSIADASVLMCSKLEESNRNVVMLPLIIPWWEANDSRANRTWPARAMVDCFVQAIHECMSAKSGLSGIMER